jgi:hypothetical protein
MKRWATEQPVRAVARLRRPAGTRAVGCADRPGEVLALLPHRKALARSARDRTRAGDWLSGRDLHAARIEHGAVACERDAPVARPGHARQRHRDAIRVEHVAVRIMRMTTMVPSMRTKDSR